MPLAELEYNTPSLKFWNSFSHDLHTLIILIVTLLVKRISLKVLCIKL
jgi:hypothetical protein